MEKIYKVQQSILTHCGKQKKKYACYALLQKTKGYISYETIFSLSSTLISNNAASLAKGQILGLG